MAEATDNLKKKRQDQYKCGPTNSQWKEHYRQKCMERLREKRSDQHSSRRNIKIQEIMTSEWEALKQEDIFRLTIEKIEAHNVERTNTISKLMFDEVLALFTEIQEEMEMERRRLDAEFVEEFMRFEEEELCESLKSLNTYQIICPLCSKYNLVEHKCMILCRCGLTINTEQDCISMKNIHDNLEKATEEHSAKCESKPVFSYKEQFGISNLLMGCDDCDFLFIIV